MRKSDFLARGKKNPSLHERIFRILFSSNHGFYPVCAEVNVNQVIRISYETGNSSHLIWLEPFFDLDPTNKTINFYRDPKSSITHRECSDLVGVLKREGYRVEGESFLGRKLRPNEILLH